MSTITKIVGDLFDSVSDKQKKSLLTKVVYKLVNRPANRGYNILFLDSLMTMFSVFSFSVKDDTGKDVYKYTLRICSQVQQKGKTGGLVQSKLPELQHPTTIGKIENADIKGGSK